MSKELATPTTSTPSNSFSVCMSFYLKEKKDKNSCFTGSKSALLSGFLHLQRFTQLPECTDIITGKKAAVCPSMSPTI